MMTKAEQIAFARLEQTVMELEQRIAAIEEQLRQQAELLATVGG